jgi:stage II sporulation protein D
MREMICKTSAVNVRPLPVGIDTDNVPIAKLNPGELVTMIDQAYEINSFSWIAGATDAKTMLQTINAKLAKPLGGPLERLQVTKRGASGRAIEVSANGKPIPVTTPDSYRSVLGGLRSTLFDIEETGSYTVLGAGGTHVSYPQQKTPLQVMQGQAGARAAPLELTQFVLLNGMLAPRVVTPDARFRFIGNGFGHGLGLSQWGAKALADRGYTYEQILNYYYADVTLVKE